MSTRLGEIKGKKEKHDDNGSVWYNDSFLSVDSFYGGKNRGKCVQLTLNDGYRSGYIQLDREGAQKLYEILKQSFNF